MSISRHALRFTLLLAAITATLSQVADSRQLRLDEYEIAALIYDSEIEALGDRALYPTCIALPSGVPTQPLLKYLQRGGYQVSGPELCDPASSSGGQHHPRDYPHGLRIFISNPQDGQNGLLRVKVESGDLTLRPGRHFVSLLRRGTYNFKRENGEFKIVGYTKEFDSKDAIPDNNGRKP